MRNFSVTAPNATSGFFAQFGGNGWKRGLSAQQIIDRARWYEERDRFCDCGALAIYKIVRNKSVFPYCRKCHAALSR